MGHGQIKAWLRVNLPDSEFARLVKEHPEYEFRSGPMSESTDEMWLTDAEMVFTEQNLPDETVELMGELRWIHVTRGGASSYLTPQIKARPIAVTSSRGIHGAVFSEFAFACMLMFTKRTHEYWEQRRSREVVKLPTETLSGKVVVIVGLGVIGTELARRAKCFGMRVLATKRIPEGNYDSVDELGGPDRLLEFLPQADFVVITLPAVDSTQQLIGERELQAMPAHCYLINLTGGNAIDEDVLVAALKAGSIRGAALDAYPRQPLPAYSELWSLPEVLITPRVGGIMNNHWENMLPLFEDNLRRFVEHVPLINEVDKELGY